MLQTPKRCGRMQVLCGGVGCDGEGRRVTGLLNGGQVSDRKKLGMCNYCQSLGPVFEQENKDGVPTFLICHNCITDVFVGFTIQEKIQQSRQRQQMRWWLNSQRNNSAE